MKRLLCLVLAASASALALAPTSAVAAATPKPEATSLGIRVDLERGGVKTTAKTVADVGAQAELKLKTDADRHDVRVTVVTRDADKLQLKIAYRHDSKVVIKSKTIDATLGRPQQLRAKNGTTLTFRISPTRPGHTKIEMPEGNDPLAGID